MKKGEKFSLYCDGKLVKSKDPLIPLTHLERRPGGMNVLTDQGEKSILTVLAYDPKTGEYSALHPFAGANLRRFLAVNINYSTSAPVKV